MSITGFGYTPAAYTPSVPSSSARFGHPDVSFPGGLGDSDFGRIPVSGGGRKRSHRGHKRQTRRNHKRRGAHTRRPHRRH